MAAADRARARISRCMPGSLIFRYSRREAKLLILLSSNSSGDYLFFFELVGFDWCVGNVGLFSSVNQTL